MRTSSPRRPLADCPINGGNQALQPMRTSSPRRRLLADCPIDGGNRGSGAAAASQSLGDVIKSPRGGVSVPHRILPNRQHPNSPSDLTGPKKNPRSKGIWHCATCVDEVERKIAVRLLR